MRVVSGPQAEIKLKGGRDGASWPRTVPACKAPPDMEGHRMTDDNPTIADNPLPPLSSDERERLKIDIAQRGVRVPIEVCEETGVLLDGHHRLSIAQELGVDCPTVKVAGLSSDEERAAYQLRVNLVRRHLSPDQRQDVSRSQRAIAHSLRTQGWSQQRVADLLGVARQTVSDWDSMNTNAGSGKGSQDLRVTLTQSARQKVVELLAEGATQREVAADLKVTQRAIAKAFKTETQRRISADELKAIEGTLADVHGETIPARERQVAIAKNIVSKDPAPITKPDLGDGISHPARFSDPLFPVFADLLKPGIRILDPFAGTGKIHELAKLINVETVGVEIEPEWADLHPNTIVGNALALPFDAAEFDAIVTSPTYGNRLADSHRASDPEKRRSYTHDLGRDLTAGNSGAMQWGSVYQRFHEKAWIEADRVLKPGGRLLLNIKDHIRNGEWQDVAGWHVAALTSLGLKVFAIRPVVTRALRQGENAEARVAPELVIAMDKR